MALLAAALTGLAVFLALSTFVTPSRARRLSERLRRLERRAAPELREVDRTPFVERVGRPLAVRLRALVVRPIPGRLVAGLEDRLLQAGAPMRASTFLAWQGVMLSVGGGLLLMGLSAQGGGALLPVLAVFGGLLAALPAFWLRLQIQGRQAAVLKALPDAVDLIVTMVEAGQSIDAALTDVGHETAGPLGAELSAAMREITLGRSRRDALLALFDRAPVSELKSLLHSVLQAEETGIPLGQVLRAQADEVRTRRRQRAEAEAGRAPVKMALVMVFLVMPAMMMFMMGPAAIRFIMQSP